MTNSQSITIIMPVYNGKLTLLNTFKSLELQSNKKLINKIIVIDDASRDLSIELINDYAKRSTYSVEIIRHDKSAGLANSYNEGIKKVQTKYTLTMHQDIQVTDKDAFNKCIKPFEHDDFIVATYPILLHSKDLWQKYTFWQKALFSRHISREERDLTGKFDLFLTNYIKKINGFDSVHYRTAGEDADIKHRISKDAKKYICNGVKCLHAQENNPKYSLRQYIRKEAQLAEARGCVLRRNGPGSIKEFIANFFREILVLGLLIPYFQIFISVIILVYAFVYTRLLFEQTRNLKQIVALYFVNISLLFINTYYSIRAFIKGKQVI